MKQDRQEKIMAIRFLSLDTEASNGNDMKLQVLESSEGGSAPVTDSCWHVRSRIN